jgi:hypothetical protein
MSIKSIVYKLFAKKQPQSDHIDVKLETLNIKMSRLTNPDIPHEVTIVVPRAEIRRKFDESNSLVEEEIILNSITIVHAPRHELAGSSTAPPEIPARFINQKISP